ncbi:MAG TPA: L,D-transpeptidase [Polyangiaceae bacterium]
MSRRALVSGSAPLVALALACASVHRDEEPERSAATHPPARAPSPSAAAPAPGATVPSPTPSAGALAEPKRPVDDGAPRVHAKTRFVWIRSEPDSGTDWIGFLWSGGSVKLKSQKARPGPGCETWYAVEPRGWVCVDGKRVTLDGNDPALAALRKYGGDLGQARPHRYGESIGLQRYEALPTREEQKMRERGFEVYERRVAAARNGEGSEALPGIDVTLPADEPPVFPDFVRSVHEGRRYLTPRSTVAYSREVSWQGRGYLLAGDYTWVPKDRVKVYPPVTFQGTRLGDIKLPLAFFRGEDRPTFRRGPNGELEPTGDKLRRLTFVKLTGESVEFDGERYLALDRDGLFVKARDAVVPAPRGKTPWGDAVGSATRMTELPKGRRSWIEVSIRGGWLIAYEDTTPVYATLISAGRGGEPVPGRPTLETASTPTGTFPITGKFATATMEAPDEFVHSDVPWVQNVTGPYALHTAYWHDNWGNLMSAGCVNLSPDDAKWLYGFTEPEVPEGWHGVRWQPKLGAATVVVIHG